MDRTREHRSATDIVSAVDWLNLYSLFRRWQRNLQTRRHLARLDAQQLSDIGISGSQRDAELAKPFWR
ncbi:DUF1127 domain-containing protein [Ectopseudomonas hydrolytica]|uniref:DUF1127 domain-containing protein n=1 Tax=Ectopseudomonas hydrolytica TaxID=2493633 RepID=UPI000BC2D713|nr:MULTISPECIES: DUF1127 domain-containing protein [unclassified Pseudomonas]ATH80053.1 hypothetical protein CO724_02315 [Pseudomonas mendocina]MBA4245411.1 DUF1127 domain-containing protein [Pseudomonas sp.]UTH36372.1 DUF1127 domain-containing protein [Pseudomonas sp. KHPS1]